MSQSVYGKRGASETANIPLAAISKRYSGRIALDRSTAFIPLLVSGHRIYLGGGRQT